MRLLKALVMATAIMIMSQAATAVDSVEVHEMPELVYREPPYANMFSPISTDVSDMDEELLDIEEFFGGADGSRSGSCTGYCHYNFNSAGVAEEIHCEVPSTFWPSAVVVGMNLYDEAGDQVIMCMYNPFAGGGWGRIGTCDLDGVVKLLVDGSSGDDKIGIIKHEKCETDPCHWQNDCDFGEFISDFETESGGSLKMYGQGGCDWIWGSQYSDDWLKGEYVVGLKGDDSIGLEGDDLTCIGGHPSALGNEGSDFIYGSLYGDYVWADDIGMTILEGAGGDRVNTFGGSDYLYMGDGDWDWAYGGGRHDYIWGGPGNHDRLFGQGEDDWLFGGPGYGDRCNGQAGGYDHCDVECETRIECNAF